MKQDIRLKTAVVVMRGTEYLVGFSVFYGGVQAYMTHGARGI